MQASAALREVRIYGGLAVFAMLLTLLLIWFVSRAIVGPLRRLTAAAREMSQRQLPALVESLRTGGDVSEVQPVRIEVTSEDEIGELAQAFNDVEAVTLEVAQEQSRLLRKGMGDLFVNLARRNQSLVQRQLELLDDLERNEHDPAALDALFKLDHMATRMRRNAESLLVLSGAEQPRQWQQPIALIDVVRAAAAEIADFPRVELVGIDDDLAVSGRAVSDVAHLLAELLENATSFSPPDTAGRGLGRGLGRPASCSRCPTRASACRPTASPRRTRSSPTRPSSVSRSRGRSACTWSGRSRPVTASPSSCVPAHPPVWWRWSRCPTAVLEPRPVSGTAGAAALDQPRLRPAGRRAGRRRRRSAPVAPCRARPTSRRSRSGAGRASTDGAPAPPAAPVETAVETPTRSRGAARRYDAPPAHDVPASAPPPQPMTRPVGHVRPRPAPASRRPSTPHRAAAAPTPRTSDRAAADAPTSAPPLGTTTPTTSTSRRRCRPASPVST